MDAFSDVRNATVAALSHPDVDDLVQGAVQLEHGVVAIVINPEALMRRYARNEIGLRATAPRAVEAKAAQRTILVVDDSVTTRTLEKSILETNGFRVILAVDGVDAINRLRGGSAVDLVVADVEMPRMDGFQLLSALKADAQLARLPVIMMTSRASPDDVRRGMELGADAYLVKQTFDQRELLATIGQLI
jgi:two-component system chemotaxis sensor kinase CheA